jgi:hypothetical protein
VLYKDGCNALQPLDVAYVPSWMIRGQRRMNSDVYSYPPSMGSSESRVDLLLAPVTMGGRRERPVEQEEGRWMKYLSLFVEALKAVATIVEACMQ